MKFVQEAGRERRFSGEGDSESWLRDLLDYAESFAPGVTQGLQPALPEDLSELEKLAGEPIPKNYRLYLETMGESRGLLLPSFKAGIGTKHALEVYRGAFVFDADVEEFPPGVFLIGHGFHDVYPELGLRALPNSDEPQVVVSDGEEVLYPIARSLPRLLLQQAFLSHELASYPVRQVYGLQRNRHTLQRVERAASGAGCSPYWFSDGYNYCGWAEGAGVGAYQITGGSGWITIGGVDAAACARLSEQFEESLGLTFVRKEVTVPE